MSKADIRRAGRVEQTDGHTSMILGQVDRIFNPDWIQDFGYGQVLIEDYDGDMPDEELKNFMEMYGFEYVGDASQERIGGQRRKFERE